MTTWIEWSDVAIGMVWLVVNVALAYGSWRVGRTSGERSAQWFVALTIYLSSVWGATLCVGSIGWLNRWTLIGLVGVIAFILMQLGFRSEMIRPGSVGSKRWTAIEMAWGLLIGVGVAHSAISGVFELPTDFDSLMYHFPIIDQWIQASSLYAPVSSYWWTPGNSEVLGLWLAIPFSGDFLVGFANVPIVGLWGLGSYRLSRAIGLPAAWAHASALASLLVFTTFDELNDGQNDIAIAALFISSAAFGLQYARRWRRIDIIGFALCVGALCGVKYNALGYAVLSTAVVVTACLLDRRFKACGVLLVASILGFVLLGGYWYLRNAIVSGSPLYPMGLGEDVATGYPDLPRTTLVGNGDPKVPALAWDALWEMTGPLHGMASVLVPMLLFGWLGISLLTRERRLFVDILIVGALCGGSFLLLLISPFCVEDVPGSLNHLRWAYTPARYGLSFLTLLIIAFSKGCFEVWRSQRLTVVRRALGLFPGSHGLSRLLKCKRSDALPLIAWYALCGFQFFRLLTIDRGRFATVDTLILGIDLCIVFVIVWMLFQQSGFRRSMAIAVVILMSSSIGIGLLASRWHQQFGLHFDARFRTSMFSQAAEGSPIWGDRIGVLEMRVYPFFGSRREVRVYRMRIVRSAPEIDHWLLENDLDVVATHSQIKKDYYLYPDTYRWLREDKTRYEKIEADGYYRLFRRKPAQGVGVIAIEAIRGDKTQR